MHMNAVYFYLTEHFRPHHLMNISCLHRLDMLIDLGLNVWSFLKRRLTHIALHFKRQLCITGHRCLLCGRSAIVFLLSYLQSCQSCGNAPGETQ